MSLLGIKPLRDSRKLKGKCGVDVGQRLKVLCICSSPAHTTEKGCRNSILGMSILHYMPSHGKKFPLGGSQ